MLWFDTNGRWFDLSGSFGYSEGLSTGKFKTMRHYEIVFLVHPDQTGQVEGMAARYREIVKASGGTVHRFEDWGLRQLAYPINKINKAHYVLMNVETTSDALGEISRSFQFNDAVIRNLVIRREDAVVAPSPIARAAERAREEDETRAKAGAKAAADTKAAAGAKAAADTKAAAAPAATAADTGAETGADTDTGDAASADTGGTDADTAKG